MPDLIATQVVIGGHQILYFAYGSNMCTGRLRRRVPSAAFLRIAKLVGHSFRFHKRSTDGSGKGDAFETGNPLDNVWGVIFDIDEREKRTLDEVEGLGLGYEEKTASAFDESGHEHRVTLYFAATNSIDNTLRPYSWYKRFVVDGARQHALPNEYIDAIAALPDMEDSDQRRDRRNRSIVC
jgi:AIG2-like family